MMTTRDHTQVPSEHSLTNKQLFNFSENPRPEVVFIGVNYVTFVSGYDPSANLSVVVWCFVGSTKVVHLSVHQH